MLLHSPAKCIAHYCITNECADLTVNRPDAVSIHNTQSLLWRCRSGTGLMPFFVALSKVSLINTSFHHWRSGSINSITWVTTVSFSFGTGLVGSHFSLHPEMDFPSPTFLKIPNFSVGLAERKLHQINEGLELILASVKGTCGTYLAYNIRDAKGDGLVGANPAWQGVPSKCS